MFLVLSGQVGTSYQMVPIREDLYQLRITNAAEFRKVRYLVIQVE